MAVVTKPFAIVPGRAGSLARFYHADCLDVFAELEPRSVDVIVTSPPYNIGVRYGTYQDTLSPAEYMAWTTRWVGAAARVLKEDVNDRTAAEVLAAIAREEDVNGRIRRNVMDTRRALSFMMRSRMLNAEQFEEARQILRDIDSLDSHTTFLFDKINFLMNATVGFININQNKIIKIFSVASVALLPPTLIASIYGMNFRNMPELEHPWGYPFAIVLMMASALVPMWYFRRRGWLK